MLFRSAYAASPLTVWFGIAMAGVFVWAGRGLDDSERRYVRSVLVLAVAIRVLMVAALFLTRDGSVVGSFPWDGDGVYLKQRAVLIEHVWAGIPISGTDFTNAYSRIYGWTSFIYVLAFVQYLTGVAPYGVHLVNVALFVTAAVLMHRLVRSSYGPPAALLGLALMLLVPSLIAWSASALKEALYVWLCALGVTATVTAIRTRGVAARLVWVGVLAAVIAAIGTVRVGASVILTAGIVLGLVSTITTRRTPVLLAGVLLLPLVAWGLWSVPAAQNAIMAQLKGAAVQHVGNLSTVGHSYPLLDQHFYSDGPITLMTPLEGLRFAIRAFVSFVVVPLPWQVASTAELAFLGEQIVWYVLVLLAGVGLVAGLKRDALVTCMLAGLSVTGAAVIALNSGNIGTMVRFRDTIVPFVVWLSALGAMSTLSGLVSRSPNLRSTPCP